MAARGASAKPAAAYHNGSRRLEPADAGIESSAVDAAIRAALLAALPPSTSHIDPHRMDAVFPIRLDVAVQLVYPQRITLKSCARMNVQRLPNEHVARFSARLAGIPGNSTNARDHAMFASGGGQKCCRPEGKEFSTGWRSTIAIPQRSLGVLDWAAMGDTPVSCSLCDEQESRSKQMQLSVKGHNR